MKLSLLSSLFFISSIAFGQNQITWGITSDVSSSTFGYNFPRIVQDGEGDPVISWTFNSNMYFARWNGSGFTTPATLNSFPIAGAGWMGPDIASKGDTIFAVYKESPEADTNSHVWCVGSFDGGITFNPPVRVDYIGDNICRFPTITLDGLGNPIVGFMRLNAGFGNAQWVVSRSTNVGGSFSSDVLASGWSSGASEVCDCCPSKIVSEGNAVAMPYRDNNSNIRDTWVGISTDGGANFIGGMDVDQQGWLLMSCPSSGPDGVIIGDNLYTTFTSSASGSARVYYNSSSISALTGSAAMPLDQTSPVALNSQNFPRVDNDMNSMAFVWKQFSDGQQELAVQFTEDITGGINPIQEIIDVDNVGAVDVMMNNGTIWVVWEDVSSGTVKYRSGTYSQSLGIKPGANLQSNITVQPNPSSNLWNISGISQTQRIHYELSTLNGKLIERNSVLNFDGKFSFELENFKLNSGIYYLIISDDHSIKTVKLIKQ
jgi:hypothetical protein